MDAWERYLRALARREKARARARAHAEKQRKTPAKRPATIGGLYVGKAPQPFTTDDPLYIKYFGVASLQETLRALRAGEKIPWTWRRRARRDAEVGAETRGVSSDSPQRGTASLACADTPLSERASDVVSA